ncbi:MAG TPA: beta-1,6-N-acetylglucosaminyltransferase [Puia sp.]|nr:beta-1,6-N-acetylglucosaminyltransferase [Puia sp.]
MKTAHLILAYKNPYQVRRLARVLTACPEFDCWVHIDKKVDIELFAPFLHLPRVRFIRNRVPVNWGGYSCLEAAFNGLREIIESKEDYDFVNLLSGQDYPIKPVDEINDFLSANRNKSFLAVETEPSAWWEHAIGRLTKYHFTDFGFKGKTVLQQLMNRLMPDRQFMQSFSLYGGPYSSYWTLSMQAAAYVHDFVENNKKLVDHCRYTWAPDEFLVSTILMNSPLRDELVNKSLRYIDWSEGGGHPRILNASDFGPLMNSSCLFARKFDMEADPKLLTKVDTLLLGQTIDTLS